MTQTRIPSGVGIYTQADAARLLGITPSRLRRWVRGYTYRLVRSPGEDVRRRQPAVIRTDIPKVNGSFALSFLELMELRVIRDLLSYPHISLQKIRKSHDVAAESLGTNRPFASRRIFTDGRVILANLQAGYDVSAGHVIELTSQRHLQIVSRDLVRPILHEVEFDERTTFVRRWFPMGKDRPVVLDPNVAFGAPTVRGSRVRTSVLAQLVQFDSEKDLALAYDISPAKVRAAVDFEHRLAAA